MSGHHVRSQPHCIIPSSLPDLWHWWTAYITQQGEQQLAQYVDSSYYRCFALTVSLTPAVNACLRQWFLLTDQYERDVCSQRGGGGSTELTSSEHPASLLNVSPQEEPRVGAALQCCCRCGHRQSTPLPCATLLSLSGVSGCCAVQAALHPPGALSSRCPVVRSS
jgi:hypothetical protein